MMSLYLALAFLAPLAAFKLWIWLKRKQRTDPTVVVAFFHPYWSVCAHALRRCASLR